MIGIVDYGAGNLLSVYRAFDFLGIRCQIIRDKADFRNVRKLVLPGVGAFEAAIENMKSKAFFAIINDWLQSHKPFLGICLGMQVLFEESEESKEVHGFSTFQGKVVQFTKHKVPQIGWNQVHIERRSKLLKGIRDHSFFYFLHGYYVQSCPEDIIVGTTHHGVIYPSIIGKDNLYAVQFHPEKSGTIGLKLLKNWMSLC